jgi:hypothetical protein
MQTPVAEVDSGLNVMMLGIFSAQAFVGLILFLAAYKALRKMYKS